MIDIAPGFRTSSNVLGLGPRGAAFFPREAAPAPPRQARPAAHAQSSAGRAGGCCWVSEGRAADGAEVSPREGPARALSCRSTGGNQRELARQKNMKKTQEISKGKRKEDSLTTSQRKQRDSEIMQQKQKAANEKKSMQTREK
ncbi:uncharacterized protein [Dasypus novemcinctus]|uniref:uncharacterized protein isoform X2 n=1 Tax=Dasypus novemcinctus TaxID=9361 RepID=UPI00265DB522|nr:small EDRK-rich factor 1 isoform X2 [Dasypus novemcinctus]